MTSVVIDTSGSCNTISDTIGLPDGTVTTGVIDPNATLVTTGSVVLTPVTDTNGAVTLVPAVWTHEILSSLQDGTELPTGDGSTCTMTGGECLTATGSKCIVSEGKLVPDSNLVPAAEASSG